MKKMMDSTTVIITTTDNRVLLQKRDENPDIEYSGYYSLVSGYLEEEETPLDGIIRELKEEFEHKKSQKVHFSSITYLGSEYRADYDRWEYIFIIKKERIFFCNQIHIPSSLEVIKKKAYQI
jgi:ADP-ribose pyrophosphatase YjhB (NUDIX family)